MTAPYEFVTKNVFPTYSNAFQMVFSGNGSYIYIPDTDQEFIRQFALASPWSLASISNYRVSPSLWEVNGNPTGLCFKPDGTKVFVVNNAYDYIKQFTLSTPWDISTIVEAGQFTLPAPFPNSYGVAFNDDGTSMFISHSSGGTYTNGRIVQHQLSVPWDVTSANAGVTWSVPNGGVYQPTEIIFNSDGTQLYVFSLYNGNIYIYGLSAAWDITTAVLVADDWNNTDYPGLIDSQVYAHFILPEDGKLFIYGYDNALSKCYVALFQGTLPPEPIWWTNFRGQSEIA